MTGSIPGTPGAGSAPGGGGVLSDVDLVRAQAAAESPGVARRMRREEEAPRVALMVAKLPALARELAAAGRPTVRVNGLKDDLKILTRRRRWRAWKVGSTTLYHEGGDSHRGSCWPAWTEEAALYLRSDDVAR